MAVSASAAPKTVQVFFTAGGKLAPEPAQVPDRDPVQGAADRLLQGPSQAGHYSDIPAGTQLERVGVQDGVAQVSFNAGFFSSAGATGMQLHLAQVVYTLTQFPSVTAVQFLQDGQPAGLAGDQGIALDRPLTRKSFSALQGELRRELWAAHAHCRGTVRTR